MNREVTSADVKYAHRAPLPARRSATATRGAYFGVIKGAPRSGGQAKEISGIKTPDDQTLVWSSTEPYVASAGGNALALPGTAPVPKEYAEKFDKERPVHLRRDQVFTGPVHGRERRRGQAHRLRAEEADRARPQPELGRARRTSARPTSTAIVINARATTRPSRAAADPQRQGHGERRLRRADRRLLKRRVGVQPGPARRCRRQGNRYISLNTQVEPLDDINVRKAVIAVIDRERCG